MYNSTLSHSCFQPCFLFPYLLTLENSAPHIRCWFKSYTTFLDVDTNWGITESLGHVFCIIRPTASGWWVCGNTSDFMDVHPLAYFCCGINSLVRGSVGMVVLVEALCRRRKFIYRILICSWYNKWSSPPRWKESNVINLLPWSSWEWCHVRGLMLVFRISKMDTQQCGNTRQPLCGEAPVSEPRKIY